MRGVSCLLAGSLLLLMSMATPAAAQGTTLPADIKADIATRFPGATIDKFVNEPAKHYEVSLTLMSGQKVDVIYKTVVTHVFAAEELPVGSLPIVVTNALQKKYPGALVKKAEKVLNAKGTIILYQVLTTIKDKSVEVHVTPAGAIVNEFTVIGQAPQAQRWEYVMTAERRD